MSFPSDVILPITAKYFGFVETEYAYNTHWDITWSFTYSLTGTQHGICSYLSLDSNPISAIPGQYLGYLNESTSPNGCLAIALDTTGLFALSTTNNNGVGLNDIIPNSLIVRDSDNVIYYESLSSLSSTFSISASREDPTTLRFRLCNGCEILHIDYKNNDAKFKTLASINISSINIPNELVYPALSYSSPISSNSISPSKIWVKNFHTQGNPEPPSYELTSFTPLSSTIINSFSNITI